MTIHAPTPSVTNPELFYGTRGPRDAKIIVIGEAWGREEATAQKPFMGHAGRELERMLAEAGIPSTSVLFTNVVNARPNNNEMTNFLYPNKEKKSVPIYRGIYASPIIKQQVERLYALIDMVQPDLIIGAGNWPLWALTDKASLSTQAGYRLPGGITKWRGSQLRTIPMPSGRTYNYLPIIHPANILRSWDQRSPTVHDLRSRAGRFLRGDIQWDEPEWKFNHRPTAQEVISKLRLWISQVNNAPLELACDIETYKKSFITCIGLADRDFALCIPLFYFSPDGKVIDYFSYENECTIMKYIHDLLTHPNIRIIGQNFNYDIQYFNRMLGIHCSVTFDTMLAHHVLWPGTPKSLDYLASLYLNHYIYWKDESQEWDTGLGHEDLWKYNCKDVRATYDIAQELKDLLTSQEMWGQYSFQLEQWEMSADMSRRGVRLDVEAKKKINVDLFMEANSIGQWLLHCMPPGCRYAPSGKPWYSSPTYSMDIFYRQLGLPTQLNKKTKRPSLDAASIEQLRKRTAWLEPLFNSLDTLRSIGVFRSHFLDVKLSYDNRLRCSFNVGGTETFRWSSNSNSFGEGTNLQNIPKGDE